ncbi:MAG: phage tail protein I [Leptotrichia hongkongensis]|uniref:phage tail protein I n=1 Tax=Leptotrichia massiliensis TaxID=1852388 RepID=UPI0008D9BB36|nr:phage tail protein I [Leptotrichia massiliensis]
MITVQDLKLTDIAAKSTLTDKTTKWIYESIDYAIKQQKNRIISKFFLDIDKLSETEIDYLLWEYHVDYVGENASLESKRELVKIAVIAHFNKGTLGSVKAICKILFGNAEIKEWFEYGGRPGYFKISTLGELKDEKDYLKVLDVVNEYKNERSWLEALTFERSSNLGKYVGIFSEKQVINILNERDFELPWMEQKLNQGIVNVVVKENNLGIR